MRERPPTDPGTPEQLLDYTAEHMQEAAALLPLIPAGIERGRFAMTSILEVVERAQAQLAAEGMTSDEAKLQEARDLVRSLYLGPLA